MLTQEELTRYTRQIALEGWGVETQEKLKKMTVFVAGAGGSGSPIITQLALLGVGQIRICDFDVVDWSNLNRQFLHCVSNESRIGVNKAISAQKTVANINPFVEVEVFTTRITDDNIDEMIGDASIIFDSVDNITTKFVLSRAALRKNIPHLYYGMMDVNSFMCIFFPPQTPCFHCLHDNEKVLEMMSLAELTGGNTKKGVTPVCCPPVFASAGFAVTEALKILLGIGEPAYNQYFLFLQKGNAQINESDGFLGMRFWITEFFETISAEQGFDWDEAWRGNYVEVLELRRNPECIYCKHT